MEFSLDGKYLAIACGSPQFRIIIVSIDERRVIGGSRSFINLKGRDSTLVRFSFNPTNRRILSLVFKNKLEIYEIKDCLEMKENGVETGIIVLPQRSIEVSNLQASVWDELGNVRFPLYRFT